MSHLCSINVFKVFEHLEKCVEGQHRVYEDTHDAESRLNYLTKRGKFHTVFHLNSYAKSYDEHRLDHGDNPGVPKNALGQSFSDFVYSLRASLKEQENSPDHYQKQLEDYDQSECAQVIHEMDRLEAHSLKVFIDRFARLHTKILIENWTKF